jgi:hypothetical protein
LVGAGPPAPRCGTDGQRATAAATADHKRLGIVVVTINATHAVSIAVLDRAKSASQQQRLSLACGGADQRGVRGCPRVQIGAQIRAGHELGRDLLHRDLGLPDEHHRDQLQLLVRSGDWATDRDKSY